MRAEPLHSHKRRTDMKNGRGRREKQPPAPNKQQGKTHERRPRIRYKARAKQAELQRTPEQAQRGALQQRSGSNSYTCRRGDGTTKAGKGAKGAACRKGEAAEAARMAQGRRRRSRGASWAERTRKRSAEQRERRSYQTNEKSSRGSCFLEMGFFMVLLLLDLLNFRPSIRI